MTFRIVMTNFPNEHGPFETFDAAVEKARAICLECSIWDDSATTNWGSLMVAVYSPLSGLRDLRLK